MKRVAPCTDRAKGRRTLVRWLRLELGLCGDTQRFAGMTPRAAWKKADNFERYSVVSSMPGWKHKHELCPACSENAPANRELPKNVLNAFRKWQRA